ncbi:MAG: hypothetical protein V7L23_12805 [Nostoc sp.]|uniref:hypothetical protein n=1 Tax=Nostoc sp. TaxID=1180 RepID=UPI002FF10981
MRFKAVQLLETLPHILHLALAIRNRGYTNSRPPTRTKQNQGFQPAQAGFACVAATSSRLVQDISYRERPATR